MLWVTDFKLSLRSDMLSSSVNNWYSRSAISTYPICYLTSLTSGVNAWMTPLLASNEIAVARIAESMHLTAL